MEVPLFLFTFAIRNQDIVLRYKIQIERKRVMVSKITKADIIIKDNGYWGGGCATYYKPRNKGDFWASELRLCSLQNPTIVLCTQNQNERDLRRILPLIEGAKCLYKEMQPWYRYDVNDKPIPCGSVSYEIWDLREIFGCVTPLGELLDYIECSKCGIADQWVDKSKKHHNDLRQNAEHKEIKITLR